MFITKRVLRGKSPLAEENVTQWSGISHYIKKRENPLFKFVILLFWHVHVLLQAV